jgi:peptide deformylase/transcriptional regulator with XRE-family HTH domain
MTSAQLDRAADAFAAALVQWRAERGLSKKRLAAEMGFDPSYVSHVEARRHRPTEDFARRAESVLQAGGMIWQRFREYEDARQQTAAPRQRVDSGPADRLPPLTGLIVEHEHATLSYRDGAYRCTVRRDLYNAGPEPVTRYLARISVDRFPGEPERSNRFYREHPLTWAELNLTAFHGDEPMTWRPSHDRDAFKEVWLLFANDDARFPLYPGQRGQIRYAYTVGEDKWGSWFQRAIRLPTRRLSVRLDLPASRRPVVWGMETSLSAEAGPLKPPVTESRDGDRAHFDWSTEDPQLNARFRLEWRFRSDDPAGSTPRPPAVVSEGPRLSDLMRGAGIVQRGAPMLDRSARWFDLPEQAAFADDVVARLLDALARISQLYDFHKGTGIAAPQLGIDWAAAVIRPPADLSTVDSTPVVLLNPRVVGESIDHDEQYEGCLSFFDVRGLVSRPLLIEVEHGDPAGPRPVTRFTNAMARLVAHEVDHLGGLLYPDRMPPEGRLIPVEEYRGQGRPWNYRRDDSAS